ncbi:hypothetical protein RN96_06415 [Fusobacterium polymorphum]|uniref:CRISPR-associated protein n=1 Tax=Fusobacterium nucleatum subsp. polymorphum TaxID=76857 RepID=A0A2B7YQ10_FUSNP|nr:hypothetical protein [Fusobacterium polymorphum]PGH22727.1 hypothetical protein RN96_06415 [Fusobacterium polymorphum]
MLNKKELEKEIEKNIKNIGYCDEKSLNSEGEILKDLYLKELNLGIIKNTISKDIENIYLNRIEREKKKLNIDTEKIKVLISTIGVVTENLTNILDETTVEKNLRVFKKIEKIYIFHTESTKNHFDNLKKRIENKYKNSILIEGSLVEESIIKMNKYLITLLKDITKFYNKDEIIMDITLGMKLSAISMYRLSVDNGVKVVNWKEIYLPIYKEENGKYRISGSNRVTFSTNLEIIKEALTENRQLLIDINNSFDRCEYETVASYYEKIGRKDKKDFFKGLGNLLKNEILLSFEINDFSKNLENFVKEFLINKDENHYKQSTKNLIFFLKLLNDLKLDSEEESYNKEFIEILEKKYLKKYGELNFDKDSTDDSIENDIDGNFNHILKSHYKIEMKNIGYSDEAFKNYLSDFSTTVLKLIRVKNGIETIDDDSLDYVIYPYFDINKIYTYLSVIETLKKVKKLDALKKIFKTNYFISSAKNLDDINSNIFKAEYDSLTKRSIEVVQDLLEFSKFKEKINATINYKDGVLQFLNLGANIDLKEKDLVLNKWNERFLNAILSKEDYKISEKYLKEYLKNIRLKNSTENFDETEKVIPANTYKNVKREFKLFVEKLNNIIFEELKEKDFIKIFSHERNDDKILYEINSYYFD